MRTGKRTASALITATLVALLAVATAQAALDGTMLFQRSGRVYLRNVATGVELTLVSSGASNNPRFSPDGGRVAVGIPTGVRIVPNDASSYRDIRLSPAPDGSNLSWDSTGHLYWAGYDQPTIYRIDVSAGTQQALPYQWTGGLRELTVSVDGTRGIAYWHGSKGIWDCDLNFIDLASGGGRLIVCPCGPTISWSGVYFGQTYADHHNMYIKIIDSIAPLAEGRVDNSEWKTIPTTSDLSSPRWSSQSDDWAVGGGWNGTYSYNWIIDVKNGVSHMVGQAPAELRDYWPGTLPPPRVDGPALAVSPSTVTFTTASSSIAPADRSVSVTNAGSGTLSKVTASQSSAWLSVTVQGSGGNTQTILNQVNPSGLATGTHTATVTVSGGGAANSATYSVVLTIGSAVAAPSALTAQYQTAGRVALAWQDNSTSETSFQIYRREGTGVWAEIARTAANVTARQDTVPAGGLTYQYRVRAMAGTDSSSWSATASVSVPALAQLTLTAPLAGATYHPGDTLWICWTAANVVSVGLQYSLDDADTWIPVPMLGGGSVFPNTTYWGRYPFKVPNVESSTCRIEAYYYLSHQVSSQSGMFTIARGTGVAVSQTTPPTGWRSTAPRRVVTSNRLGAGATAYRLDGSIVTAGSARSSAATTGCLIVTGAR